MVNSLETLYKLQSESNDIDVYNACEEAINAILSIDSMSQKLKSAVVFPCRIGDRVYSIIGEKVYESVVDELCLTADDIYVVSAGIHRKQSDLGKYWFLDETIAQNAFRLWKMKSKGEGKYE